MSQEMNIRMHNKRNRLLMKCQNCGTQHETIKQFKAHVRSHIHKQEVAALFHRAVHKGPVFLPMFVVLDYLRNPNMTDPVIGLDMVTLCITPEKLGSFYLCHVCKEHLASQDTIKHLCSVDHYFNYLSHSNPELLRFAWFKDSFSYLQASAVKENHINGPGTLRILELPNMILKNYKKMAYEQVMLKFLKMDKLMERVRADRPQMKILRDYITDSTRTNPLLGLNCIIEFSCSESDWHCGYLCTLCKKKLLCIEGISHCISFDHIYSYMQAAHPSTLKPKSSYTYYSHNFHKKILYLANRAQKKCPAGEVEVLHLDLPAFKDIFSSSYINALNKLQQIRRERNQSVPEDQISCAPETHKPSANVKTTYSTAEQEADSAAESRDSGQFIFCVECGQTFSFITGYKKHITGSEHQHKLRELFGSGLYSGHIPEIKLYTYLWARHRMNSPPPAIGLKLITVLVNRLGQNSGPPIYLCHACEISISTTVSTHLTSTQHYFNVFAHTQPDLVFLGAQNPITEFAQEEEMKQGKEKKVLRVCEIPDQLWRKFESLSYEKIMATFEQHYSKLNKCFEVTKRVTLQSYAKSSERMSPLLGLQFMVKYSTTQPYPKCAYLCLLCERNLSEMRAIAHVLSSTHVFNYLNVAHPGSLSKDDEERKTLIVDLAQQAEALNPNDALQEVELDFGKFYELDSKHFKAALDTLQLFFRQKGLGELKPPLVPGARLESSLNKEDSSQGTEQRSTSVSSQSLDPTPMEGGSADCTTPSLLSNASLNAQQSEPKEMDIEPLNQEIPPHHNPTETKEFHSTAKPDFSSFDRQQRELPQNSGEMLETPQKLRQPPGDTSEAKTVPQDPPACNELRNYLEAAEEEPVTKSSLNKEDSSQGTKQGSTPVSSDAEQMNLDPTPMKISTPNINLKPPDVLPKSTEPLKTTNSANLTFIPEVAAGGSADCTTPSLLSNASLNTQQPEPKEMDIEPLNQEIPPHHNPTETKEFHSTAKPDVSIFDRQQRELPQNSGEMLETPQKLRQPPGDTSEAKTESSLNKEDSSQGTEQRSTSVSSQSLDPTPMEGGSADCTTPSLLSNASLNAQQSEPKEMDIEPLNQEIPPHHNPTETKEFHSTAKPDVSSFDRQQRELPQNSGNMLETPQKLRQPPDDTSEDKTVPQDPPACNELRNYLEDAEKEPVTALNSKKEAAEKDHIFEASMKDGSISDTPPKKGSDEDPVQSSPHLWSFLTSPSRTEPVIGLSMITEFRSFSGQNSFVCACCEVMLPTTKYMCHLIDPRHHFTYMKNKHSKLVEPWKDVTSLTDKVAELRAKAKILQDSEGWGQLKVVEKDFAKQTARNADISTKAQKPEPLQTTSEMVDRDQQSHDSLKQKSANLLKKKMKQHGGALIGLNFVTCVFYGKRKLYFCELCSVKCHFDHLSSVTHKKAFLKKNSQEWRLLNNSTGLDVNRKTTEAPS